MTVVLDTCAIVWAIGDPARLPDTVAGILTADDTRVCVSAVSCAEIACASQRGRIDIDRHWRRWFRHYVELNGWTVLPIDLDTVEEAYALARPVSPGSGGPAHRRGGAWVVRSRRYRGCADTRLPPCQDPVERMTAGWTSNDF